MSQLIAELERATKLLNSETEEVRAGDYEAIQRYGDDKNRILTTIQTLQASIAQSDAAQDAPKRLTAAATAFQSAHKDNLEALQIVLEAVSGIRERLNRVSEKEKNPGIYSRRGNKKKKAPDSKKEIDASM